MTKERQKMNILYCTDTNYVMPMTVSITSVFENNKDSEITIHVFYSSLSEDQRHKLNTFAKQYNQTITLLHIDEHYFANAPTLRWSKEAYYRLLITELLPQDLGYVLYLDCDTIINKSLINLFNTSIGNNFLSALAEESSAKPRLRLKLNPKGEYFQSGVLLFDIKKCKEILSYKEAMNIVSDLNDRLEVVDQDVINVMFDGRIKPLDKKFNNCEITNFEGNNLNRFLNHVDKKQIDETVILHYATGKPWNQIYSGSCEDIWYRYLRLSPYSDLYIKKYNSLKYRVLRFGISKVLFFEYIHITPFINKFAQSIFSQKRYSSLKNWYRKNIK